MSIWHDLASNAALVLTSLGVGGIGVKLLSRGTDQATEAKTKAEATSTEVETIRSVLAEVRASDAAKTQRLSGLEERIERLEERERHALTRAAVHEAWDQMAFAFIAAQQPTYPAPPPLAGPTPEEPE